MNNDRSTERASEGEPVRVVPVVEEALHVEKRVVERGGFRISKRVVVREEVVDEPLLQHDVRIERRPIGRLLDTLEAPPSRQEGDTLVLSVVEEVLVTQKRLMLKEEVRVTRTASLQHRPQTVSLRSEEVSVERTEP